MQWITRKFTSGFILVIICFGILYGIYGRIMIQPNQYMLCDEGEGLRNYYVMCYQLQSKNDWTEFKGLNYPYGQHLTYSDGQPVNTVIGKLIASVFPGFKNNGVGWINIICLYSLILGTLLIFLALAELKLPYFFAIIIAIALMMICPQVWRMKWQQALSVSCFIPSIFFLLVKINKTPSTGWKFLFFINGIIWFLVHPYLGFMHGLFLFLFFLVQGIQRKKITWRLLIPQIILVAGPAVIFNLFLLITDHHTQREANPYGIIQSSTFADAVLLSPFSPFSRYYKSWLNIDPNTLFLHLDGSAYLGISAILFSIFMGFRFVWIIFSKKRRPSEMHELISITLVVSLIMMLLGFAFLGLEAPVRK